MYRVIQVGAYIYNVSARICESFWLFLTLEVVPQSTFLIILECIYTVYGCIPFGFNLD